MVNNELPRSRAARYPDYAWICVGYVCIKTTLSNGIGEP